MRRAVVISVLLHLLVLLSLLGPPSSPAGRLQWANGSSPLQISFKSLQEIDQQNVTRREAAMVLATEQPIRPNVSAPPVVVKGHHEKGARGKREDPDSSVHGEPTESLGALPADLERAYRIDLARAARRSPYYPAALVAKGEQGVVRMSIVHWGGLGPPSVTLVQSSGYRELDQEALKALTHAIRMVSLPAGALGIHFRMQYTLEYRLPD